MAEDGPVMTIRYEIVRDWQFREQAPDLSILGDETNARPDDVTRRAAYKFATMSKNTHPLLGW